MSVAKDSTRHDYSRLVAVADGSSIAIEATAERAAKLTAALGGSIVAIDALTRARCLVICHEPPLVDAIARLQSLAPHGVPSLPVVVLGRELDSHLRHALFHAGAMEVRHDLIGAAALLTAIDDAIVRFEARRERDGDAAIRARHEFVAAMIEQAADAYFVHDMDGRFLDVNRRACESLGYTREELLQMRVTDIGTDFDLASARSVWAQIAPGTPFTVRGHQRRKDGSVFPVEVRFACTDVLGKRLFIALCQDITEAKRIEEELRMREARFRRVFETNLLGVIVWDIGGAILDANDEFLRIVGYDRADLEANLIDWARMTPPEHRAQDQRAVRDLHETGRHAPIEKEYVRKDGSRVWVLVGSAFTDARRGVGFVLDISGRKESEAALRDSEARFRGMAEALRDADRRKDEFIGVLAHELRNPLAPVRMAVEIMRRVGPAEARVQRVRDVIDRQVTHMARLIDDLLDVSRIARGKLALKTERCDLPAIARQTAEDYRPSLEAAGLRLIVTEPDDPMWVEGDAVRLAQMIGNLLHNAGRFTDAGGVVEVRSEIDRTHRFALVHVIDTGVGIEPELIERLFDPFSQADQDLARSKGGLGLGLALTKGLAVLHAGDVTVQSDGVGHGATFTLRIPLGTGDDRAVPAPSKKPKIARLRILVVEDNRDAAETLADLLRLGGHDVMVTFDGAAALAAAESFEPDVVVSDIGLPGQMDGYEVARALRASARFPGLTLIALSGYANEEARRRSREAGFDVHLAKPPDIASLDEALASVRRRS